MELNTFSRFSDIPKVNALIVDIQLLKVVNDVVYHVDFVFQKLFIFQFHLIKRAYIPIVNFNLANEI